MITQNEISSLSLSPTKKDFVQIWNELIEVASKITERWDPTSTNESDPGIVLLKVLTGIADKLNYNIDKNILEAYMPTAAQMESMRKLCELVGYDIKYYQSAETRVRISYTGNTTDLSDDNEEKLPITGLALPKFTTITNADKDITFVTTNAQDVLFMNDTPWVEVPCIEGQISKCESTNDNNIINLSQLDDNNRYYLPEIQIAENGIFVYNVDASLDDGIAWEQVSNLNTQPAESRVFKFGFDSLEGRPYLAFPADVGSLIGDGLFIYFVRTSGLSGNINAGKLEVLEIPTGEDWNNYSAELFEVVNNDATTNGANIESISTAYNNFKKTVGTFDTLVTCRDYMNKIYSLMNADNSPYVSNILVTDIRNDINNAITLCSCNEFGLLYKETPLTRTALEASLTRTVKQVDDGNGNTVNRLFIGQSDTVEVPLIDHFDLILYPFQTFTKVSTSIKDTELSSSYNKSFTYTEQLVANGELEAVLSDVKTCAHNFTSPAEGDIVAINNYLRLNALIATSNRISEIEAKAILHNVKVALVNEFNLRNLDFGEEIPFDSILSVIENADSRIKAVSLQEPLVLTTYSVKEFENSIATSKEYGIVSTVGDIAGEQVRGVEYNSKKAKEIYNKLVLRNILAGRASLFEYDETFVSNNSEKPYTVTKDITEELATAVDNSYSVAIAIQSAINKILDDSESTLGEYILDVYDEDNKLAKTGLCSADSVLTLRIFEKDITTKLETTLANNLDDNYQVASQIKASIDSISEPGEYILYDNNDNVIKGFYEGSISITLIVSKQDQPTADEEDAAAIVSKKIYEKAYELYETYEPTFIEKVSNQTEAVTTFARTGAVPAQAVNGIIDNVAKVEATCEITSTTDTFKNITLNKNEVIKFRAPNLITTKTFPAYVYYRFERANNRSRNADGSMGGSYASALSLKSFITDIGGERFFSGLWTDNASGLKQFIAKKSDGTNFDQSDRLSSIFNTALAVYAEGTYNIATNEDGTLDLDNSNYTEGGITICIDRAKIDACYRIAAKNGAAEVIFKYYPLISGTKDAWSRYIKKLASSLPDVDGIVLWELSSTNSYPMGKLVTESGKKLSELRDATLAIGDVGEIAYICTELGSDPIFSSITENSDVELQAGDRLYIHYTPSSTNEDGETVNAEPVSIVYEGGKAEDPIILKPSGFTLTPSEDVHRQGTSWKKTNVEFTGYGPKNLLSLAPNEQIELRSISKVVLDKTAKFYKNFDNAKLERGSSEEIITYELKDGEYLFYTDPNAQGGVAYYGSGSLITLDKEAYIPKAAGQVEISRILEQGQHVIPWGHDVLLSPDRKITITEYQYTTLVEGDTLNTLTVDPSAVDSNGATISNAQWTKCLSTKENPITYTVAGAKTPTELQRIELASGLSTTWEVSSFLELSTSPGYAQTLRAANIPQEAGSVSITNKVKVYVGDGTSISGPIEIVPQETVIPASDGTTTFEPVSIKLNTIAQVASGNFDKPEEDSEANDDAVNNLQMKVFSEKAPSLIKLSDLDTAITPISVVSTLSIAPKNINNYWSAVEITDRLVSENELSALNFNFMIPDQNMFGIFSIYLDTAMDKLQGDSRQDMLKAGSRVFIEIPKEFGMSSDVLSIFNYPGGGEHSWWSEGIEPDSNRLYLRAGLNCIKVTKSCNLLIKAENDAKGAIIYDNLRLVKGVEKHGINLKLIDYKLVDETDEEDEQAIEKLTAEALLNDIKAIDKGHEFYYNAPIENSLAIEFNKNINSFSNPYTLYDVNNINNNFVVSKLDVKYLDAGLRIAKSSRY